MSEIASFGAWLRHWRNSRDLTQAALAQQAGCALGTFRNIEADNARPSVQLAARLARTLGVPEAAIEEVVAFARGSGSAPVDLHPPASPLRPSTTAVVESPAHLPLPPRTNLPAQLTGLIGRSNEVREICALLLRPDVHIVTLTGAGGTGKTRVAMESARQLQDAFADGVTFVDLAAIRDPELVLTTIAQTLGVSSSGNQSVAARLAAALRNQARVLLLDNFEQVLAAGLAIAHLLAACPQLKVLITSRIALGIAGEHEWPIPPLTLPNRAQQPLAAQVTQYDSVRLFSERAYASDPQFALTDSNASAVAEICYQLDGLPLAIELAAARVKLFSPQALLARLDHRLTLLTSGGRDRPTRQQTIRNTIAWSYQLLTPDEQSLFQRLAVFTGGTTLAAIEAICGTSNDPSQVVYGVAALVNQHLLRRLPAALETDAEPRFGMLETIREYALELLDANPDADALRQRHAHFFTRLAETADAQWATPTIAAAIAQFQQEHDNLRAALRWMRDSEPLVGLQLAGALSKFWKRCGYYSEGRAWVTEFLALNKDARTTDAIAMRLRATEGAAWLASDQHDFAQATQLLEQSIALRRDLGEVVDEAKLLMNAALSARATGQYVQATSLFEDAVARHRATGNRESLSANGLGLSLYFLGLVLREQGNFERARTQFEACVALHRALDDQEGIAFGMLALSDIARDQGNVTQVQSYCEQSLAILRTVGVQTGVGFALNNLALVAYTENDLPHAFALIDEAQALFRAQKFDGGLAEVLITLGLIVQAQGNVETAYTAMSEALRLAAVLGPRLVLVFALEGMASIVAHMNQAQLAVRLLVAATALRAHMGTLPRPIDQPVIEQALATARSSLGSAVFATTWAEATNLPVDQLIHTLPVAWELEQFASA